MYYESLFNLINLAGLPAYNPGSSIDLTTEELQEIIVSETIFTPEEITVPAAIQVFFPIIIGLFS